MSDDYIRDLIYLDVEKAASIYSQMFGGLLINSQSQVEEAAEKRRGLTLALGVLSGEAARSSTERDSVTEARELHHHLLVDVERAVFDLNAAVDLNEAISEHGHDAARGLLAGGMGFVRVEGWASIEDYGRIRHLASEFKTLVDFINKCAQQGMKDSAEYQAAIAMVEEQEAQAAGIKDREQKAAAKRQIKDLRAALDTSESVDNLDDWLINGIKHYIDTFLNEKVLVRVYPDENMPSHHVLGSLKRDCFTDGDLGNTIFAYSPTPNVRLTLLALVTSVPTADDARFNPLSEFDDLPDSVDGGEQVAFEKAMRGMFDGVDGIERFARFSRYPNITVYPVALYRKIPVTLPDEA